MFSISKISEPSFQARGVMFVDEGAVGVDGAGT
jgi:hypothetical protein